MIRYWAMDVCRNWNKRSVALLIVLSMLLSNIVSVADTTSSEDNTILTCGLTEHVHTDACYEDVLACGKEESEPQRTFRSTFSVHRHSSDCYDEYGSLICGKEETQYNHIHNDYCQDEYGSPVCGLDLRIPHTHTDECYDADQSLICGREDTSNLPTFTCTADNWIETEGHHHDASCYEHRLTCGLEEHTHTADCYETIAKADETEAETQADKTNNKEESDSNLESQKHSRSN